MKKFVCITIIFLCIVSICIATPIQWTISSGGNGHYYEAISVTERINWIDANIVAENKIYLGLPGHLVTITSESENDFVATIMNGIIDSAWAGGYQPAGSPEPDGNWQWVTGESWSFFNWRSSEPNNDEDENALEINSLDHIYWPKMWNDLSEYNTQKGYVVEYVVPESATIVLLTLGGLALRRFGR